MANRIKGITIDIDGNSSGLEKSLKAIDVSLRDTQSKLKDVNKLLKLDPSNVDLLRQKQDYLNKAVDDTRKREEELKKALKEMEKAGITDENQEQQRALQRELVETTSKLKDLEKQAAACHPQLEAFSVKAKEVADKTKPISTAAAGAAAGMVAMAVKSAASADDLLTLSNVTGFTVEELQKMQYASSFVDVSMESMTGAVTKLTKSMNSGSSAFETLGVKTTDVFGNMRSANSVFYETLEALGKVQNETERDALSMEIFGKSAMEMAGIVDDGGAALKALGEEAEETGLIMSEDAVASAVQFNDQMDKLKNTTTQAFFKMGASLSTSLLPAMEKLVNAVLKVVTWFGNLDGTTQTIILTMLGLVAAISPVASLLGNLNTIVTVVSGAFGALGGIMGTTAVTIGALTVPIGAVIAIAAGLVAAGVLIYKNWDKIKEMGKTLAKETKTAWNNIKKFVTDNANALKKKAETAFTNLSSVISTKMNSVTATVSTTFTNVVTSVGTAMTNAYNAVANSPIVSAATTVFSNVYNTVSTKMTDAYNKVSSFVTDTVSKIQNNSIVSAATTKFESFRKTIADKMKSAYDKVADAMADMKKKIDDTNLDKEVTITVKEKDLTTYANRGNTANNNSYVTPYASAYTNAVMFTRPTVLPTINGYKQFGDRGGSELVIGTNKLMNMIAQASGGGVTVNMTVNGSNLNANEVASIAVDKITNTLKRTNARW